MAETVYILGAGASCAYGLPTGATLRNQIIGLARDGPRHGGGFGAVPVRTNLFGASEERLDEFVEAFEGSFIDSIDLFLERRPEYTEIGKRAIVAALMPLESKAAFGGDECWLRYLFNQAGIAADQTALNDIAFITFNYDRLVEIFFYGALRNTLNLNSEEMKAVMALVKIHHLHGSLGPYEPWVSKENPPILGPLDPPTVAATAPDLQLFHETDTEERVSAAKRELDDCERLVFLGFGYSELNIRKLFGSVSDLSARRIKTICGSITGLKGGEEKQVKMLVPGIDTGIPTHLCLDFLRHNDAVPR